MTRGDLPKIRAFPSSVRLLTTAAGFFARFGFRRVSRANVPTALRATEEFAGACPASAAVMRLDLNRSKKVRRR